MKTNRAILVLILFTGIPLVFAAEATKTGFLIDAMCGEMNAKNAEQAANHKVACALMPSCASSGFGIVSEGGFYKFDASGDEKAAQIAKGTQKMERLEVKVTGDFQEDSVKVSKIEELE